MFSAIKIDSKSTKFGHTIKNCTNLPSVCAKRAPQPHVQPMLFFSMYLMVVGVFDMCHKDRVNPAFCTPNLCCNGIDNARKDDELSAARTKLFIVTFVFELIRLTRKIEKKWNSMVLLTLDSTPIYE